MIGVYFEADCTRIVKAVAKKNMLQIITTTTLEPYLQSIRDGDVEDLVELFSSIGKAVGSLYEEFYLVLPDADFNYVDCGNYTQAADDEKNRQLWLETQMKIDSSKFYFSFPVSFRSKIRTKKTGYCIQKDRVDGLIEAARTADISLVSIEPLSFAYLRSTAQWNKEQYILEVSEKDANIMAYSPVAGIFKMSAPDLAWRQLENLENIHKSIGDVLMQCDTVAKKTFEDVNANNPIHIIAPVVFCGNLEKVIQAQERLAEKKVLHEFVQTDMEVDNEDERLFLVPMGTLLQVFDQEEGFYGGIPTFLSLSTANVLPHQQQVESKMLRIKKITKKYTKFGIFILLSVLLLQIGGILYFASIHIPEQLQTDYEQAQGSIETIKKEAIVIKKFTAEHQFPFEAIEALLSPRPTEINFTRIQIGERGSAVGKSWVQCEAKAASPILFRDYTDILASEGVFGNVNINQITTDSNGMKQALIMIGRGKLSEGGGK